MAKFRHGAIERGFKPPPVSADGKSIVLNGGQGFVFCQTTVTIETEQGTRTYVSKRGVIETPKGGAKLLPYFRRAGAWHVVMVEQFRICLPGQTLEAAGGQLDEEDIAGRMAAELDEEAKIKVDPKDIKIVTAGYIQPSMMPAKAYGGIVLIDEEQLPTQLLCGEHQFDEFTVVAVRPLLDLLRQRDRLELMSDFETHALLDAVAEAVGLITRNY